MHTVMIAAAGAAIALGPVFGAGAALAEHPLPACEDVYQADVPCQSQRDPVHPAGTNHDAPPQQRVDNLSAPSVA
ncbi:hypothetical protein ABIA39_000653 [Nocardia sp. GAS34]|uniref:hypothetical protein n=1 Tax=unclassified Nocardia TaxID=2637762 RepID=UPI003D1CAA34